MVFFTTNPTHPPSLTHTHSLSLSPTHSLSLSLSHTHTHTQCVVLSGPPSVGELSGAEPDVYSSVHRTSCTTLLFNRLSNIHIIQPCVTIYLSTFIKCHLLGPDSPLIQDAPSGVVTKRSCGKTEIRKIDKYMLQVKVCHLAWCVCVRARAPCVLA